MADLVMQILALLACGVIILRSEPALNRMSRSTHGSVRFAMYLALVGAVARVEWIRQGNVPDAITVIMLIGMAFLIVCERRLRVLTGAKRRFDDSWVRRWL